MACATQAAQPGNGPVGLAPTGQALPFQVVLVAGDSSIAVFDNATHRLARDLRERGGLPDNAIHRLSANPREVVGGVELATRRDVVHAIASLNPSPGQACLIYATSHGEPHDGLVLSASGDTLLPSLLNIALQYGCRDAPTVLVLSGCFSGVYAAAPVAGPNRIVITAARPDRTSFGCAADLTYTYFDECLLDAMDGNSGAVTWRDAFVRARACVAVRERAMNAVPSEPQAAFGADVGDMPLPWRNGG
jgi:hypothetical protein